MRFAYPGYAGLWGCRFDQRVPRQAGNCAQPQTCVPSRRLFRRTMPVPHFGQLGTSAAGVGNGDGSQFAVFAGPRTVRIIASKAAPSIREKGSENFSSAMPQTSAQFKRKCSLTPFRLRRINQGAGVQVNPTSFFRRLTAF